MNNFRVADSLRGLAALAVCFYHFVHGHGSYLDSYPILKGISSYGWLGVEVFFVISGFVISFSLARSNYTIKRFPAFFVKRLLRIEPPYVASIFIGLLLFWLSSYLRGIAFEEINFRQLLLHFGYLIPFFDYKWYYEFYWTLSVEFQFYIFIGIFYSMFYKNKKSFFISIYLIALLPLINDSFKSFLSYSTFFCFGFLAKEFIMERINKFETLVSAFLLTIISFCFFAFEQILVAVLSFVLIVTMPSFNNSILLFLGRISYSLYLLHNIFGGRIINYLIKNDLGLNPFFILSLGLVFSIIIASFFYKFIEKPSINFSRNFIK